MSRVYIIYVSFKKRVKLLGWSISARSLCYFNFTGKMTVYNSSPDDIFQEFKASDTFSDTLQHFNQLCEELGISQHDINHVYDVIKSHMTSHSTLKLFQLLDARRRKKEYKTLPCSGKTVSKTTINTYTPKHYQH